MKKPPAPHQKAPPTPAMPAPAPKTMARKALHLLNQDSVPLESSVHGGVDGAALELTGIAFPEADPGPRITSSLNLAAWFRMLSNSSSFRSDATTGSHSRRIASLSSLMSQ